jgi:peptidoglycan/xylan/chitin deacetylase (PgdA/CDA1 family)
MRMRGIGRLKSLARRLINRFVPGAIILLYHRVTELSSDPQLLCVSRQHFAEHLEILRKHGSPTRLRQAAQTGCGRREVIVTFDDGYADNLDNAKPLLERYDVPATIFVTTGYVGSRREFWKDYLERIFLQPGTLPAALDLSLNGEFHQWPLGAAASYSTEDFRRHSHWNVTKQTDPTPRQRLYRSLCQLLGSLSEDERRRVVEDLLTWAGMEVTARPTHRILSADEVLRLAEGGLVEVGSHTVTHPVLSTLPLATQRNEILSSKIRLEEILGHPVSSFAYPYGGRSHYTAETVTAVREAGFDRACSNFGGVVRRGADMWQLPRFLVRDWDGEEFADRLGEWVRH